MCALVTGVQTCALPISTSGKSGGAEAPPFHLSPGAFRPGRRSLARCEGRQYGAAATPWDIPADERDSPAAPHRRGQLARPLDALPQGGPALPQGRDADRRGAGGDDAEIGRAHVRTPGPNAHHVCTLEL